LSPVTTYVRLAQRKEVARSAARALLATTRFQDLTLRAVADDLDWPLGTLHRAYSTSASLLNDVVLEYERQCYFAVFAAGPAGLARELSERAHRWSEWLGDPAHEQLLRYQVDLVCRHESPLAQDVPHARTSSQHFQRAVLGEIAAAAGETYREPDYVASLIAALHDGFTQSFLEHGDRDRLRAELQAAVPPVVGVARPRRDGRRNGRGAAAGPGA
jgi:AcrR family transcriptional regulator